MSSNTFASLRPEYGRLLATVKLTRPAEAEAAAKKVFKNANRYKRAGQQARVPWPLIGALDLRESDCNPRAALAQGDPWNQVSTHVPKNQGPYSSWEEAAVFALHYDGVDDPPAPWAMDVACYEAEKWNGWGYRNKGIFSPYLWAGTNQYTRGKYVADGQYSASAVDQQLGVIPVLWKMVEIDPETYIGTDALVPSDQAPPTVPDVAPYSETGTRWIQSRLNILMVANSADPDSLNLLRVDGNYGRRTRACVRDFQTWVDLPADGQAGDLTTAVMDRELRKLLPKVTP